eukprot:1156425-Pelagomonas_calceolata.AAC.1
MEANFKWTRLQGTPLTAFASMESGVCRGWIGGIVGSASRGNPDDYEFLGLHDFKSQGGCRSQKGAVYLKKRPENLRAVHSREASRALLLSSCSILPLPTPSTPKTNRSANLMQPANPRPRLLLKTTKKQTSITVTNWSASIHPKPCLCIAPQASIELEQGGATIQGALTENV